MAAAAVTIGVTVLNDIVGAIPGAIALWNAIVQLRTQNPAMTAEQTTALMQSITTVITTVGADEVSTLALIAPPK